MHGSDGVSVFFTFDDQRQSDMMLDMTRSISADGRGQYWEGRMVDGSEVEFGLTRWVVTAHER